jgi:hypothetical protein
MPCFSFWQCINLGLTSALLLHAENKLSIPFTFRSVKSEKKKIPRIARDRSHACLCNSLNESTRKCSPYIPYSVNRLHADQMSRFFRASGSVPSDVSKKWLAHDVELSIQNFHYCFHNDFFFHFPRTKTFPYPASPPPDFTCFARLFYMV